MTEAQAKATLSSEEAQEVFDLMVSMRGGPFATNEFLARLANAWVERLEQKSKFLFEDAKNIYVGH